MAINRDIAPHLFVVIGGTGDLMRRKLLPALYHLATEGPLGGQAQVLGVARSQEHNDESFRAWADEALKEAGLKVSDDPQSDEECRVDWCSHQLHYHSIGAQQQADWKALAARVEQLDRDYDLHGNRVFYLSIPPDAVPGTLGMLAQAGLNKSAGFTRVVIEKPFGRDTESAIELNNIIHEHFDEDQTYRIDHYLGKHTVQNLLVLRFANPIFESIWNRELVQSVQITVAEQNGVGTRADFYERTGALRDIIQNHVTQLLALTAMEVPAAYDADAIRDEKTKVLRCVQPIRPEDVVYGQYAAGLMDGEQVRSYRFEDGTAADSETETFVAMRLYIANWRWQGVPFYLRTGKRLPRRVTQIVITFRCPPLAFFQPFSRCNIYSNALVITLQPDEGFDLTFEVKAPEETFRVDSQHLKFRYGEVFGRIQDAYENLLLDVVRGDATLFVRADEAEQAWRLYTPLQGQERIVHPYAAGTWGPEAANRILRPKGLEWLTK